MFLIYFLKDWAQGFILIQNAMEIHASIADINVSRAGILFEKELNRDSYLLSSNTQATQIQSSCFKFFLR
jgi:hypothetical protein